MLCIQACSEHSNITNREELNRIGSCQSRRLFYLEGHPDHTSVRVRMGRIAFLISGFEYLRKRFMMLTIPHES